MRFEQIPKLIAYLIVALQYCHPINMTRALSRHFGETSCVDIRAPQSGNSINETYGLMYLKLAGISGKSVKRRNKRYRS